MAPEVCPVCEVPWGDLPEDHSAIIDPYSFMQVCQNSVSADEYARIKQFGPR